MEQNNNQLTPQAPEISESEMKMPEDQFGDKPVSEPAPSHSVNPLFIVALILLLTILAVVVIWGEEIVGMFLPETTVKLEPLPAAVESDKTQTGFDEMEKQLNEVDLSNMDEQLNTIEVQMDGELKAESATGTKM